MNRTVHVVLVLSILTVFVIVAFLNIDQSVLNNDNSVAIFLNKGYVNEINVFADQSSSQKPYSNIKPRKYRSNYSKNVPSDLNVPLNTQSRIKFRNSGRKSIDATNSGGQSTMGLSYNQSDKVKKSYESLSMGTGALGYSNRGTNNSSGGGGATSGGLLAYQTSLVGQTSSFFVPQAGINNTMLIDPQTDPLASERIPVGDGLGLLSLFTLLYVLWKFYLRS